MISGVEVRVKLRADGGRDALGNRIEAYSEPESVGNVLVAPGACADLDASRPEGVRVACTLHFPKTFTGDLRGALVELPAPWTNKHGYRVVGAPYPLMDENTPTPWHMPVEVEAVDG